MRPRWESLTLGLLAITLCSAMFPVTLRPSSSRFAKRIAPQPVELFAPTHDLEMLYAEGGTFSTATFPETVPFSTDLQR